VIKKQGKGYKVRKGRVLYQRERYIMQMTLTKKDEITFMEQEFLRLIDRVQRDEDKKLRLIVDNTSKKSPARIFMDEE
jgi:hypothetical protein